MDVLCKGILVGDTATSRFSGFLTESAFLFSLLQAHYLKYNISQCLYTIFNLPLLI